MKLVLELPDKTMCAFVNYIYCTADGMIMGATQVDGDDLLNGKMICKGAKGYDDTKI